MDGMRKGNILTYLFRHVVRPIPERSIFKRPAINLWCWLYEVMS